MPNSWYKLSTDIEVDGIFFADKSNFEGREDERFLAGEFEPAGDHKIRFWSSTPEYDGTPRDILANVNMLPVFSERLQESLCRANVGSHDVQFVPVEVRKSDGEVLDGFAIANILSKVKALDVKNTKQVFYSKHRFDPETGEPEVNGALGPVFFAAAFHGHDIVRVVELGPPIFVSDRFAQVIRAGDFSGVNLTCTFCESVIATA